MTLDDLRHRLREAKDGASAPTIDPATGVVVVLGLIYFALGVSVIAVAVGVCLFVLTHVGPYAALSVGGVFTFGVSYVTLRVVDALRKGVTNE